MVQNTAPTQANASERFRFKNVPNSKGFSLKRFLFSNFESQKVSFSLLIKSIDLIRPIWFDFSSIEPAAVLVVFVFLRRIFFHIWRENAKLHRFIVASWYYQLERSSGLNRQIPKQLRSSNFDGSRRRLCSPANRAALSLRPEDFWGFPN